MARTFAHPLVPAILVVAVLLAALAAVPGGAQQAPVFKGTTETVPVYVTVTDKDGRLVGNLSRESFTLLDEGKPQEIALFDNTPQPVRLVLLLDLSGSMFGNLGVLREASRQLFARLRPDDRVRVGTFGEEIAISPEFTSDPRVLEAALPDSIPANAPTPLWTAANEALDAFGKEPGGPRRVVLVLSDGKDTGPVKFGKPFYTLPQIMERAQREEVMIYSVGLRSRAAPGQRGMVFGPAAIVADWPDPGLAKIAEETGGGYFEIRPRDDLAEAFARAVDELHAQYLLGFAPAHRDGKRHKIEVKLNVGGMKARSRRNYVAPKA